MPQRPDFSERSLSGKLLAVRHPTNGKEAVASAPVDLSFGFSVTVLRGDRSNQ